MLGLLNLYKIEHRKIIKMVEENEAFIPLIETLTICLKDKDNDFLSKMNQKSLILWYRPLREWDFFTNTNFKKRKKRRSKNEKQRRRDSLTTNKRNRKRINQVKLFLF